MIRRRLTFLTLLIAASAVLAAPFAPSDVHAAGPAQGMGAGINPIATGLVAAKGVNDLYRIGGLDEPLPLLRGGLGKIGWFWPVLATLARYPLVIGVDLHCQGRSGARVVAEL